jgi:hypothetical protein
MLNSRGKTEQFLLLTATCRPTTILNGSSVSFTLQQRLREGVTLLRFKYGVSVVSTYLYCRDSALALNL